MNIHVYTLNLKPDPVSIAEYKAHHQAVWPEVTEALHSVGVVRDEIYVLGARMVMILWSADGGTDPLERLAVYEAGHPRFAEWGRIMSGYQEKVPEAREGEWWASMERVFLFASGTGGAGGAGSAESMESTGSMEGTGSTESTESMGSMGSMGSKGGRQP